MTRALASGVTLSERDSMARGLRTLLTVVAASVSFAVSAPAADVVEYYHLDAIGNVRAVTNQAGQVIERHDYLPFGEECTTAPCTPLQTTNTRKLTGKERDPETGLDYFGARYYGSRIGRFTTVDPVQTITAPLSDPQRWNRYAYGRNNPLRFVDPDGRSEIRVNPERTRITVLDDSGREIAGFPASNRTTNPAGDPNTVGSNGPAPAGTFPVQPPVRTEGTPQEAPFGPAFFPVGAVDAAGRPADIARQRGIGIHAGRRGVQSPTQGCVRVDEPTIRQLEQINHDDPIRQITIPPPQQGPQSQPAADPQQPPPIQRDIPREDR